MKETSIRIDCVTNAKMLNRYLVYCTQQIFNTKGSKKENVVIKKRSFYQVQWINIFRDLKTLLINPKKIAPQIAWSLAAFYFIFLGEHSKAVNTAFIMGALAFDAAGQTSHSGEPATITWNHTIGSGSDRAIIVCVSGLSGLNAPLYAGNSTTEIMTTIGALRAHYQLAPATGSANCSADGGNIKVGGSISFSGVDQTDPIGATTSEDGSSSPNDMTLTTEANNSVRVDIHGANRDDSTDPTVSLDSGTERFNDVVPQNQFRIGLFGYTNDQAVAGADTHQWSTTASTRWYMAFEVKESSGGGGAVAPQVHSTLPLLNVGT